MYHSMLKGTKQEHLNNRFEELIQLLRPASGTHQILVAAAPTGWGQDSRAQCLYGDANSHLMGGGGAIAPFSTDLHKSTKEGELCVSDSVWWPHPLWANFTTCMRLLEGECDLRLKEINHKMMGGCYGTKQFAKMEHCQLS